MNVTSALSVRDLDGNIRTFKVGLDYNDLLRMVGDGKVTDCELGMVKGLTGENRLVILQNGEEVTVGSAYRFMSRMANRLLAAQLVQEGLLTEVEAKERLWL